ncbi:hypothetical protein F5051DRAFT_454092 [Lentinula edodes]|nr:hypothetical protein F5051DRAFT_454092 [Lentinula edodes]
MASLDSNLNSYSGVTSIFTFVPSLRATSISSSNLNDSNSHIGAIIGVAVGGLIALNIAIIAVVLIYRSKRRSKQRFLEAFDRNGDFEPNRPGRKSTDETGTGAGEHLAVAEMSAGAQPRGVTSYPFSSSTPAPPVMRTLDGGTGPAADTHGVTSVAGLTAPAEGGFGGRSTRNVFIHQDGGRVETASQDRLEEGEQEEIPPTYESLICSIRSGGFWSRRSEIGSRDSTDSSLEVTVSVVPTYLESNHSTSPSSSPTSSLSIPPGNSKSHTGAIVGGAIGGGALAIIIIIALRLVYRLKRKVRQLSFGTYRNNDPNRPMPGIALDISARAGEGVGLIPANDGADARPVTVTPYPLKYQSLTQTNTSLVTQSPPESPPERKTILDGEFSPVAATSGARGETSAEESTELTRGGVFVLQNGGRVGVEMSTQGKPEGGEQDPDEIPPTYESLFDMVDAA